MKTLNRQDLDTLALEAKASPRLRMNRNLHQDLADPIQRLAIAMEPGTYIRPHHHTRTWEMLTALRGRFVVLCFDDAGRVIGRTLLGEEAAVVEIPVGGWHAVLSLDTGGIVFEVKHGPYLPFSEGDFAPWSPRPDSPASADLMRWFATAQLGERWAG